MKYCEMREMTFAEWCGTPFEAYRTNNCDVTCDGLKTEIVGYVNGKWVTNNGIEWLYVYPVDLNKENPKRMTNRQLAMWLAKGNGQLKFASSHIYHTYSYCRNVHPDDDKVHEDAKVRKWDSEEWIEPTADLL